MKVCLILKGFKDINLIKGYDYIIGVDKGSVYAINNGIIPDMCVGDFDSTSFIEFNMIKEKCPNVIKLNPIKDNTDTAFALEKAFELSDDVTIIGGISGKRIEHLFATICLYNKYKTLKMIDDNSIIFRTDKNIEIDNKYKFISLFAIKDVKNLTLSGFKYDLNNYNLNVFDPLCVSNEVESLGKISFDNGSLLVVLTKDDKI